ncbi:hypothetical protein OC842_006384 [Tilletia horrida]|uniref:Uncharacterized protein n=1 Tax=Tilletia horrida TaxID=155126 RepID=A0AAN6JHM5_9BASI|nr:hypothetical protein OC842_006384 [Tilletia horrida]
MPLYAFIDDVSGASSKRWNKHIVCYIQSAALDGEDLGLDATIRIFAATKNGSVQEVCEALTAELEALHSRGVWCWDALRGEAVLVFAHLVAIVSDNPMAAELGSNIGMKGKFNCRSCTVGGSDKEKESAAGLRQAIRPGTQRTVKDLKKSLEHQLDCAVSGASTTWSTHAADTGVKDKLTSSVCTTLVDEFKTLLEEEGACWDEAEETVHETLYDIVRDNHFWNPLFRLLPRTDFDVCADLPCEILHTVLLGTVKYLTRATFQAITSDQKAQLGQWIAAANTKGISDGSQLQGEYLVRHHRSMVGKDFKRLCQVLPWVLARIGASAELQAAWEAQGSLAAALHARTIPRATLADWKEHLYASLDRFFLAFAKVIPQAIIARPKMHLLTHAVNDLARFGPLPTISAERFESFNAVVRQASIMSNRKHPSRDIVGRLSDQDVLKDIVSGSSYYDHVERRLRRPGRGINNLMSVSQEMSTTVFRMFGLQRQSDRTKRKHLSLERFAFSLMLIEPSFIPTSGIRLAAGI